MGQGAGLSAAPLQGGNDETMRVIVVEKLWGREKIIANEIKAGYCLKELTVDSNGMACSIHYHKNKTETFYVTQGRIFLELYDVFRFDRALRNRQIYTLHIGHSVTLVPYTPHRFWALDGPGVFIEGSSFDNPRDSYRLVPSGPIPTDYDISSVSQYMSL